MTKNNEGDDKNRSRGAADAILSDSHVPHFAPDNKNTMSQKTVQKAPEGEEKEELDEFGLPVPKIRVNSRPPSLYSDSFASARSSIDGEGEADLPDEGAAADVEDNDMDEETNGVSSPGEWPRLSQSTLPGSGHVKSSPFHAPPSTKDPEKETVYAERAKDLVKALPVSNSIFKRKDSPIEQVTTPSRSVSFGTCLSDPKDTQKDQAQEPPRSLSESREPTASSKEPSTESPDTKPNEEKPEKPQVKVSTDISHSRNASVTSPLKSTPILWEDATTENPAGASEWSHQLGVIQTEDHSLEKSRKSVEEDEWQSMPAYASFDVYDDDGRLVARQWADSDDEVAVEKLGGAGRGYTRMNQDEDAQSADSMDENTQYLFTEGMDDENAKTPLSQMQATKEFLTEGQRIAYVGLCKLTMVAMLRDVGRIKFKENRAAYESMTLWSQKMMIRLFGHMDISPDEQVMIEQLSEHGVIPADLIPSLMVNVEVSNPLVTSSSISDIASTASQQSVQSTSSGTRSPPTSPEDPPPIMSPSTLTSKQLNLDLRWTVLCDLFLVLIADSVYDARSRVLLERMGSHLCVPWIDITRFERRVTEALQIQEAGEQNWKEEGLIENRAKQARNRRYMMMGLATLGGGLVIGLSAGLLAPVIGAGLGAAFTTVGITGTTGFLAGTGGAALITTGGVVTGGSIAGKGMAKRTQNVKTFEFRPLHNNQRVNCLVTVSGKEDDVRLPFSTVDPVVGDIISLLWEPEILQSMGQTMNLLATEILTQSLQQVLGQTVLVALMSSIQWPMMLTKLGYLIDNPWSTSLDRAAACGLILADCLMHRNLGQRPISLAGFSLGARVIYYCLLELAKHKAYGLIQDVYLFGTPVIIKQKECLKVQSVVAGRIVNGYKSNDWILGYLFRASTTEMGRVAGLRPIENCGDIENLDCTEIVGGHLMYRDCIPKLMKEAGFLVVSEEFSEVEDPDPDKHRERQIALYDEIEEAKRLVAQEEADALKAGKKVKKRGRKSGFLGLWGKEIDTKPAGLDETKRRSFVGRVSSGSGDYDLPNDLNENSPRPSGSTAGKKSQDDDDDDDVLFDVDKMREELAANGITVTTLESTLPPLVLTPPLSAPVMHRSLTTPTPVAPAQRTHSPSLPAMTKHNASTSRIDQQNAWTGPRDITPQKPLAPLVLDTKRSESTGWVVDLQKDTWDSKPNEPITMSFMPDSPDRSRALAFPSADPAPPPSISVSSDALAPKLETGPISSVFSMPYERNVWDDDYQEESGGNITMSFE